MEFKRVKCSHCSRLFLKLDWRVNEAKKIGWRSFCSNRCQFDSRRTGKRLPCSNPECRKTFYRPLKELRKVARSFCSHTCSAIVNNRQREENRPKAYCAYQNCNLSIPRDQKYCSRLHGGLAHRISKKEYEKRFIGHIKTFYKKHKRIPVKREMYGAYKEARIFYGSWNKAIEAAGYIPNPVMFSKKYVALDGHKCDSFAEKVIDDWLHEKNIKHERGVKYPGNPKLTADFVTARHWIEFFGLSGELRKYDLLKRKKEQLAKKYKLPLIALHPNDLFPQNRLSEVLKI